MAKVTLLKYNKELPDLDISLDKLVLYIKYLQFYKYKFKTKGKIIYDIMPRGDNHKPRDYWVVGKPKKKDAIKYYWNMFWDREYDMLHYTIGSLIQNGDVKERIREYELVMSKETAYTLAGFNPEDWQDDDEIC